MNTYYDWLCVLRFYNFLKKSTNENIKKPSSAINKSFTYKRLKGNEIKNNCDF